MEFIHQPLTYQREVISVLKGSVISMSRLFVTRRGYVFYNVEPLHGVLGSWENGAK